VAQNPVQAPARGKGTNNNNSLSQWIKKLYTTPGAPRKVFKATRNNGPHPQPRSARPRGVSKHLKNRRLRFALESIKSMVYIFLPLPYLIKKPFYKAIAPQGQARQSGRSIPII